MKNRPLARRWRLLTSGTDSDILALVNRFRASIILAGEIDETNIAKIAHEVVSARKNEKINEYIQGRYGRPYDIFWKEGKQTFPEDLFRAEMMAIRDIPLKADCILAGFLDDGFSMLLETDSAGRVRIKEDFAVVGEGGYLAQTALLHRQITDQSDLNTVLYCVFEAKKYAERVGSVGPATSLGIFHPNGKAQFVEPDGLRLLQEQFERFGPQKISGEIGVTATHLWDLPGT